MDNTANGGTACHSSGDLAANSATCSTLFTIDSLPTGGGVQWATLKLSNVGTLDSSNIQFAASQACATAINDIGGPTFTGANDLCPQLKIYIAETNSTYDHADTAGDDSDNALGCAYGTSSGAAAGEGCAFATQTLATLPSSSTSLTLASGGSGNTLLQLTHGQSRYFVIGVQAPDLANSYQNRKATFNLTWKLNQA